MSFENEFMQRRAKQIKQERVTNQLKEFPPRTFPNIDHPGEFIEDLSEVTTQRLQKAIGLVKDECFEFRRVGDQIPGATLVRFVDFYRECSVITGLGLTAPVQFSSDKRDCKAGYISLISTFVLPPVTELYGFEPSELKKIGFVPQLETVNGRLLVANPIPNILIQADTPPSSKPSSEALIREETALRGVANELLRAVNSQELAWTPFFKQQPC